MNAGTTLANPGFHRLQRVRNLGLAGTGQPESLQSTGNHRFDPNLIARSNPQHRRYA
jgi:hypothetical protein